MGGFFGAASKEDCVFDLFFGVDYHSHLGTRRAGLCVYDDKNGFDKAIHNIENAPFRTKFNKDFNTMHGTLGIGCISDYEAQPILVRSHHGTFAVTTVGKINNSDELVEKIIKNNAHFFEMQGGDINQTELVAAIIDQKDNFIDGIRYAQEVIDGSISILALTPMGIYAARDKLGRTPIVIGQKSDGYCASFESFAYVNLGYTDYKELGPGEIVVITPDEVKRLFNRATKCEFVLSFGFTTAIRLPHTRASALKKCATIAARRSQSAIMSSQTSLPAFPTAALPTQSAIQTRREYLIQDRLSNIRPLGRVRLCPQRKQSAILSQK